MAIYVYHKLLKSTVLKALTKQTAQEYIDSQLPSLKPHLAVIERRNSANNHPEAKGKSRPPNIVGRPKAARD